MQTIYHDDVSLLDAVAIDKDTAKIAVLGQSTIYIYRPHGLEEASLRVRRMLVTYSLLMWLVVASILVHNRVDHANLEDLVMGTSRGALGRVFGARAVPDFGCE